MATHSSVLAWRIPGTEKPGGLLSVGLHRVGHDCSNSAAAGWFLRVSYISVSSVAFSWAQLGAGTTDLKRMTPTAAFEKVLSEKASFSCFSVLRRTVRFWYKHSHVREPGPVLHTVRSTLKAERDLGDIQSSLEARAPGARLFFKYPLIQWGSQTWLVWVLSSRGTLKEEGVACWPAWPVRCLYHLLRRRILNIGTGRDAG